MIGSTAGFAYVWAYRVRPEHEDDFLAAYGPDGDWARLFGPDPHYLGTELLGDPDDEQRFLTIDYWTSRQARDVFRDRHAAEFEALDLRCEDWTRDESHIGDFVPVRPAARSPDGSG